MPVIKTNGKLLYFAHVPKCGGASVDEYLIARFGSHNIGFLDSRFSSAAHKKSWNRTSPQHIAWTHRQKIMPDNIFDHQFALVRHPMNRIISMFKFNHRRLRGENFHSWLLSIERLMKDDPYYLDNHARRAIEIVPPGAKIFKLEDGLGLIPEWLDRMVGGKDPNGLKIGHTNKSPTNVNEISITDGDVSIVYDIYRKDYDHFGYERNNFNV